MQHQRQQVWALELSSWTAEPWTWDVDSSRCTYQLDPWALHECACRLPSPCARTGPQALTCCPPPALLLPLQGPAWHLEASTFRRTLLQGCRAVWPARWGSAVRDSMSAATMFYIYATPPTDRGPRSWLPGAWKHGPCGLTGHLEARAVAGPVPCETRAKRRTLSCQPAALPGAQQHGDNLSCFPPFLITKLTKLTKLTTLMCKAKEEQELQGMVLLARIALCCTWPLTAAGCACCQPMMPGPAPTSHKAAQQAPAGSGFRVWGLGSKT